VKKEPKKGTVHREKNGSPGKKDLSRGRKPRGQVSMNSVRKKIGQKQRGSERLKNFTMNC